MRDEENDRIKEEIETLKIIVRNINQDDIKSRNLSEKTKGILILEILNRSPLARVLSVNDIDSKMAEFPVTVVGQVDGEIDLIMDVSHGWTEFSYHVGDSEFKTKDPYGALAVADAEANHK